MSITKVYVGNLDYSKSELEIRNMFKVYGKVGKTKVIIDPNTNKSKGIAFLQMYNHKDAKTAISELNGKSVDGRTLKVSIAIEREGEKPLRSYKNKEKKKSELEKELKPAKRKKREKGLKVLFNHLGR